jgi:hypothetical protein
MVHWWHLLHCKRLGMIESSVEHSPKKGPRAWFSAWPWHLISMVQVLVSMVTTGSWRLTRATYFILSFELYDNSALQPPGTSSGAKDLSGQDTRHTWRWVCWDSPVWGTGRKQKREMNSFKGFRIPPADPCGQYGSPQRVGRSHDCNSQAWWKHLSVVLLWNVCSSSPFPNTQRTSVSYVLVAGSL